jgi:hypothetical protein
MAEHPDSLVLDLVEWVAKAPRIYADVIAAWRTSCPRLTVWEDAIEQGFIERRAVPGEPAMIGATAAGRDLLVRLGRLRLGRLRLGEAA